MAALNRYLAFGTPDYSDAEVEAVVRVMRSGWLGMGPETLEFERELSAFIGAPHVITVNSCTSALFLSLLIAGVGPGDEVILPSLTWCSTANAVLYLGARPVLCDVDPVRMGMTLDSISPLVTSRTKAVIPVHYGGLAVDVAALREGLPRSVEIIEDAAHALGASYSGRAAISAGQEGVQVGSNGNLACFSFYANKNLSTAEGGAITLFDEERAERLSRLRLHGMESHAWSRYIKPSTLAVRGIAELGYKMNYTDLQAAIGRVQLRRFGEMAERRRNIARRYLDWFATYRPEIVFQAGLGDVCHAHHLIVGIFDALVTGMERDALAKALRERQIGASIHWLPLHHMPLYKPYAPRPLPVTDRLAGSIMTLPVSASMSLAQVDEVCRQFGELLVRG